MSEPRPRAVAADVTPAVLSVLQEAGLDITEGTADDLLAQADRVDAQLVVVSRRSAARALITHTYDVGATSVSALDSHGLSGRELEVLQLVATGKKNTEIASVLVISPKTVKNHISRIFSKLGLKNRVEAAVFAVRQGMV
jgi:DNA-binding NarL/FixJ family response regulator